MHTWTNQIDAPMSCQGLFVIGVAGHFRGLR
jgi:hypothetical protein